MSLRVTMLFRRYFFLVFFIKPGKAGIVILRGRAEVCWRNPSQVYSATKKMHKLQPEIERFYSTATLAATDADRARQIFQEFRQALTLGQVRAAEKQGSQWRGYACGETRKPL